jgi:Flp pilus assembly protein TadG
MTRIATHWNGLKRREEGAAAVEFAIIIPVFLMIVFGIITFGAYLSVVHSVQQLAAEAARASVGGLTDNERVTLAEANIRNHVGAYLLIDPARLVVEQATTDAATSTFSVRLRYDAAEMFIFQLPTFVPMPPPQIVRSAAIQRGGY